MKTRVNPYFLNELVALWTGMAELSPGDRFLIPFVGLDATNETQMKDHVRMHILPRLGAIASDGLAQVKLALAYCLSVSRGEFDFRRYLESKMPPFDVPENARDVFVWIWEVCFPGESWQINVDEYEYYPDANAAARGIRFVR